MAAGRSSLPGDLANLVADRLLATNDLDSYMGLRAVCHGWRTSTADPRSNPRFQPRQWVMVDEARHNGDDSRVFVNAANGRFVRRNLRPAIHSHFLVAGAGGGWLVLAERCSPHAARLLNPFTGSLTQFAAPVPPELELKVAAHVIGSSPTLLLLSRSGTTVYWADPSSERFIVFKGNYCNSRLAGQALAGGIYAARGLERGSLASLLHPTVSEIMGLVKTTTPPFTNDFVSRITRTIAWKNCFLVESAGEIFIVFILRHRATKVCVEVFKMATGRNELEPVKNIGNRAIFVGACRSLSVDADKFASVQANCIYYVHGSSSYVVYSLDLEDEVSLLDGCCTFSSKACVRVVDLLCSYASYVQSSQLRLALLHREIAALDMEFDESARRHRRFLRNRDAGYRTYDSESDD